MKVPTGIAMMPYASGIFQYWRLYACPHPGNIADRRVAIFGSCLRMLSFALTGNAVISFFDESEF